MEAKNKPQKKSSTKGERSNKQKIIHNNSKKQSTHIEWGAIVPRAMYAATMPTVASTAAATTISVATVLTAAEPFLRKWKLHN